MGRGFVIPSVFKAIDKYTAPLRTMAAATRSFAQKAEVHLAKANRAFTRLMTPITRLKGLLGNFGLFIGGAAIVGGVGNAIGVFASFEQANANLAAVMGVTIEQNKVLADDAQRLGAITAKTATEVVGLQEAYARLGFSQREILDMTEATIAGSVGLNGELAATAELTGAMVRTFDKFNSTDTPEIIDQMTLATQKSALNFEKLSTSLPIVAGAANAAGIDFTTLLALLGKLSDAGIDASSSATALRNIFLESASKGHTYSQIIEAIQKNQDKLTAANDAFGKRAAVSATILANQISQTAELDKTLQMAAKGQELAGVANIAAAKQLDTLTGKVTIMQSAYEGWVLSIDNGNGALSEFLKTSILVITDMFTIASGVGEATKNMIPFVGAVNSATSNMYSLSNAVGIGTGELSEQERAIRKTAEKALKWLKVIGWVIMALIAMKTILIVSGIIMNAYKLITGAWVVITKAAAAAQWLLNAAVAAFPVILIIAAIAALIVLVVTAIQKYNEWGAALLLMLGPLGLVINLIQSFRRNWDMITKAFSKGGIVAGLKAIGVTLLDAVLMPLQQLLTLLSKIPGFIGDFAAEGADKILQLRERIGVNTTTDEQGKPLVDTTVTKETLAVERSERTENQRLAIDINDPGKNAVVDTSQLGNFNVNLGSTTGY